MRTTLARISSCSLLCAVLALGGGSALAATHSRTAPKAPSHRHHRARTCRRSGAHHRKCARVSSYHKAPNTTITSGPSGSVTATTASFSFTASISGATFQCKLDAGSWGACTSPAALSGLTVATHVFSVRAVYKGIVDGSPASRTWTVTAPSTTTSTSPTTTTSTTSTTPTTTTTTSTTSSTPTTTTTTTSSTPTTTTTTSSASPCLSVDPAHTTATPQTTWRAIGSAPLSDAEAAALVSPVAERRSNNATPNHYCPTDADLSLYHSAVDVHGESETKLGYTFNPYHKYVSGRFVGTTDEIIEWAAHKWGVPEDVLRAEYVHESWWNQSAMGDRRTETNPLLYPAFSRISGTSDVFESLGLTQVKWHPDGSVNPGTEPLRWESTAFNVDYQASVVRFYYDDPMGHRSNWGDSSYYKGDPWLSIGGWYNPYPWNNSGQLSYISNVQKDLANRTWAQPGF